ncbi:MAG: iron ABC transporter permease, partial [Dialister sp.]|nr:iron ABC transporter permease [Dialister sp.]
MKNGLKEIGFAAFLLLLAVLLVLSLFWALSIGTVKLPLE